MSTDSPAAGPSAGEVLHFCDEGNERKVARLDETAVTICGLAAFNSPGLRVAKAWHNMTCPACRAAWSERQRAPEQLTDVSRRAHPHDVLSARACSSTFHIPDSFGYVVACVRRHGHEGDHFAPPGVVWPRSEEDSGALELRHGAAGDPPTAKEQTADETASPRAPEPSTLAEAAAARDAFARGKLDELRFRERAPQFAARLATLEDIALRQERTIAALAVAFLQTQGLAGAPSILGAAWALEEGVGVTVDAQPTPDGVQFLFTLERAASQDDVNAFMKRIADRNKTAALRSSLAGRQRQGFPRGVGR